MFDQVVVRPGRRRFKTFAIVGSAIAHAAVAAGLIIGTMWSVDKVDPGPVKEDIVFYNQKPPAGAAAQASEKRLEVPKRREKRLTKDLVQPTPPTVTPPAVTTGPTDPTKIGPGETTDVPGECVGDDCPPLPCPPDQECTGGGGEEGPIDAGVPVDAPPEPCNLPPTVTGAQRVAGDDQIRPTREIQLDMMRSGKESVRASFKLCIDTVGKVSSVRRQGPGTGYGGYDEALEEAIWTWRYKPAIFEACAGRAATSICTVATFVYKMKD